MSYPNGNGSRMLWWLLGGVSGPIILALTGTVLNLGINSAQRISTLEAQFNEVSHRLQAIENKLDKLIQRPGSPPARLVTDSAYSICSAIPCRASGSNKARPTSIAAGRVAFMVWPARARARAA